MNYFPSPVDLPDPEIELGSPSLQVDSLPTELSVKPFLSFIMPILTLHVPLISPVSLKRSLAFSTLFFSSILCMIHLRKPSYLSLLFFGTLCSVGYLSLSPLPFDSLLSTAICKPSLDNHFAFVHLFFFGMVWVT